MTLPLLDVQDFSLEFRTRSGTVRALQNVNLRIAKGEIVSVDGRYGIQVAEVVAPARGLEGFERRA